MSLIEVNTGEFTVMVAVFVAFPRVAVSVEEACEPTGFVETVKLTDVCPAKTTTEVGGAIADTLPESDTVVPPTGAGAFKVNVAATSVPPVTVEGVTESEAKVGGTTVSVVVLEAPWTDAVRVTAVEAATGDV